MYGLGMRNPVRYHGTRSRYVALPTNLACDTRLSYSAIAVAVYVWSFGPDDEISVPAIVSYRKSNGGTCSRATVERALKELEGAGWLVRQPCGKSGRRPFRWVWHIQRGNNPFMPEQIQELTTPVSMTG